MTCLSRSAILSARLSIHRLFNCFVYVYKQPGCIVLECEVKPIMEKSRNFERSNTTYFLIYYGGLMVLYLIS